MDKILSVLNTIQLESRVLKAICIYLCFIILLQIFTSTKQIYDTRPMIHLRKFFYTHILGFLATRPDLYTCFSLKIYSSSTFADFVVAFCTDCFIFWWIDDLQKYGWLITLNRSIFGTVSICRIIYGYFTYWLVQVQLTKKEAFISIFLFILI